MSKEVIVRCDVCGAKNAESLSLPVGRSTAASGSMETDTAYIDLCRIHLVTGLTFALEGAQGATIMERNQSLFDYYKKIEWKEKRND